MSRTRAGRRCNLGTRFEQEHAPSKLVRNARLAEDCGFDLATISDHYHPWIDQQGQSAFVWATLGGIAQATSVLGSGLASPVRRFVFIERCIAQAAATVAPE